jgi:uncharacterized Zn finger protein (UPF0148 family)
MTWTHCENCRINVNLKQGEKNCPECGIPTSVNHDQSANLKPAAKPVAKPDIKETLQVQDQPTYQQIQKLIDEVREIKELVKILRWSIPLGFVLVMIYLKWLGVKVNLSPTIISPFIG